MTSEGPTPQLVPGPLVRSVNPELVNAAALTLVECVDIASEGVWFADTLPEADEVAVRDWLMTKDDEALARRVTLRGVDSTDLLNGFDILRAYMLGDPLPAPVYPPPPEPDPFAPV